ncbi:MAG TPA: hypothetical protein VNM15_01070 [Candidatus Binatia bacterium]|nr:hypothetical protein [Candidatus Binatia bacterium]
MGQPERVDFRSFLLPTLGNIVFVSVLFVLIFRSGQGLLGDGDTGYHIKTGEVILQTWRVPQTDIYSFHWPPLKWTAHEWLSETLMAAVFMFSGLTGVVIFFAFLLAITHWLLYRTLRARSDDIVLCILITLLATAASSSHWLARPHAFSLLFTVIWCQALDRFQAETARTLRWLPLIMPLWVNLHGGYFIGLVILAIYAAGNFLSSLSGSPDQTEQYRKKAVALSLALCASAAVCVINPRGFDILLFPLRLATDRFVMDRVTEFMSPNFHGVLPFKYMFLAAIGLLALSRRSLDGIEAMLMVLLSYMALYSARHVSLFAIVVAPLMLKAGESVVRDLPLSLQRICQERNRNLCAIDARLSGYLWPALGSALVIALALVGSVRFEFDEKIFPVKASEFLKAEKISGKMFNNDEFGDYMIFSLWPTYRVFMDGRSDMYGEKFGADYLRVANAQPGWKETLKKHDISWVIFDTQSALTAALQDQADWQPIYSDAVATIFLRKEPQHETLLKKYAAVSVKTR